MPQTREHEWMNERTCSWQDCEGGRHDHRAPREEEAPLPLPLAMVRDNPNHGLPSSGEEKIRRSP